MDECLGCLGLQHEVGRLKQLLTELRPHLPDTDAVREIRQSAANALGDLSEGVVWSPRKDNGRLPQWEAYIGNTLLLVTKGRPKKYNVDKPYSWYCGLDNEQTQIDGDEATEEAAKAAAIAAALGTV